MSLNKQILIGNLGKDPELKTTPSGTEVVQLSMATNEKWKDSSGQQKTDTQWHNLVFWGAKAKTIAQYGKKGMELYVEGKTEHRTYTDSKTGVEKRTTQVRVDNFVFVGSRGGNGGGGYTPDESNVPESAKKSGRPGDWEPSSGGDFTPPPSDDDDIPF